MQSTALVLVLRLSTESRCHGFHMSILWLGEGCGGERDCSHLLHSQRGLLTINGAGLASAVEAAARLPLLTVDLMLVK